MAAHGPLGVTLADLGTDLLDNILRHLGVASRDHCAAASACAALRCRYLGGAKNPLLRVFEAGKWEAPPGLRAQLRELGTQERTQRAHRNTKGTQTSWVQCSSARMA